MKKITILLFLSFVLLACGSKKSELTQWVEVKLNYHRVNENIILAIEILNTGKKDLWGLHSIVFLVDNKEHKSPFNVPKFWLFKAMLPSEPKYLFEYLKVPDVIALLGPGKHRIKLKYGPVLSNEIELEVEGLHQLKENVIYCSPYVKEMGDSLFGKKH